MPKKQSNSAAQYQLFLGYDENGKRICKKFYGKNKTEARKKAEDYRRREEEYSGTLGQLAAEYLAKIDDSIMEARINFFVDKLGKKKIAQINAVEIEDILAGLAAENPRTGKQTAQRTLARYLQDLEKVFAYAAKKRLIAYDPCKFVELPKGAAPKKRGYLNSQEREKVLTSDHKATLAALIMTYCGLRRGELTALVWELVDIEKKVIHIISAWSYKLGCFKLPKTAAGYRDVPIPDVIIDILREEKAKHKPDDFVITNDEGNMMTEASWHNFLKGIVRATGVQFTWHMLRHTYASILYTSGVPVLAAQKFLGHASATTTMNIYTHLEKELEDNSIDNLNNYLNKVVFMQPHYAEALSQAV